MKYNILLFLLLVSGQAFAQTGSPLQQVISSNSMINRPPLFHTLHSEIGTHIDGVEPGLQAEVLYEKMSKVREFLIAMYDGVQVNLTFSDGKLDITVVFPPIPSVTPSKSISKSIQVNESGNFDKTLKEFFDQFEGKLAQGLAPILESSIKDLFKNDDIYRAGLAGLVFMLEQKGFAENFTRSEFDDNSKVLAKMVARSIRNFVDEAFEGLNDDFKDKFQKSFYELYHRQVDFSDPSISIDDMRKLLEGAINDKLDDFQADVKEKMVKMLDKAEFEVTKTLGQLSDVLISLNTGVAINKGANDLGGGIHVSFEVAKEVQVGVFTNLVMNETASDSVEMTTTTADTVSITPRESLVGLQARMTLVKRLQLDAMLSVLLSKGQSYGFTDVLEAGVGASWRFSKITVGATYFQLWSQKTEVNEFYMYGLNLQIPAPNAPSFSLGRVRQDTNGDGKKDNTETVFQVTYPFSLMSK